MSTDTHRDWFEQVAEESIEFDRAMEQTLAGGPFGGAFGPNFSYAQSQLRSSVKRLDPKRATVRRLEYVAGLAMAMIEARYDDGPDSFFYEDVASAILSLDELRQERPARPELGELDEMAPVWPGPRTKLSPLAEAFEPDGLTALSGDPDDNAADLAL